jgi:hypothetical protein
LPTNPLVEKALDDLNRDYGGDMVDYLGPEWREILREHIQTAVDSSTERLRGLLARLEWAGCFQEEAACPACEHYEENGGHDPGCWLAAELQRRDPPASPPAAEGERP